MAPARHLEVGVESLAPVKEVDLMGGPTSTRPWHPAKGETSGALGAPTAARAAAVGSEQVAKKASSSGQLETVTLQGGETLRFSFLFLFLGATPCTEWLDDVIGRDDDGFILTGAATRADNLLETTVPGVFAAGDVRSGSTKRCATAVGEGAWAVQLVHAHLATH
jgi:thioredoxin reductase